MSGGGRHQAARFAEADPRASGPLAPAAKDHPVAVLQESTCLAALETYRALASRGQLEQRAGLVGLRARLSAAAEEVSGLEIAAVDGVVRDHLCDRPVAVAEVGSGQSPGRQTRGPHGCAFERHLEMQVDRAARTQLFGV